VLVVTQPRRRDI